MRKKNIRKDKKGFTLVELLAVIVVLAIVMGLAAVAITSVLNNTRKSAFVTDAKSFIDGARDLVNADGLNSSLGSSGGNYAPSCTNGTGGTKYIPVNAVRLESGGTKSPYGNDYLKGTGTAAVDAKPADGTSYVQVTSVIDAAGECTFSYSIFLSDGVYAVGTQAAPVAENSLDNDDVQVIQGS